MLLSIQSRVADAATCSTRVRQPADVPPLLLGSPTAQGLQPSYRQGLRIRRLSAHTVRKLANRQAYVQYGYA
jgi:hypothetical protein